MEKKVYEEPSVKKVEFDFNERIAASGCNSCSGAEGLGSTCIQNNI